MTEELAVANSEEQPSKVPEPLQPHAWQPGQSGNPSGRPNKLKSLTGILESKVNREEIAEKLLAIATDSSSPALQLEAIKYIYARIEGSPVQALRHQIDGNVPALIFLHPGLVSEQESDATIIEATSVEQLDTDIDTQALGSQSSEVESE